MRLLTAVSALLLAGVWPGPGEAQSLDAIARSSTRARSKASKVYTDADLRAARGPANYVELMDSDETDLMSGDLSPEGDLGDGGGTMTAGSSGEEARAQRLADLKKKVDDENKIIAVVQQAIQQASAELNDLTALTYGGRRGYLVKIVEDGQAELAKSRQVLADVEEMARREGFSLSR